MNTAFCLEHVKYYQIVLLIISKLRPIWIISSQKLKKNLVDSSLKVSCLTYLWNNFFKNYSWTPYHIETWFWGELYRTTIALLFIFSSPGHEVLKVNYCDHILSVSPCVFINCLVNTLQATFVHPIFRTYMSIKF